MIIAFKVFFYLAKKAIYLNNDLHMASI